MKDTIEIIAEEQALLSEKMHALRKDELTAREKVKELKKR